MRNLPLPALIVTAVILVPSPAAAGPIINGSFETGNFTAWTTTGDALVVTSAIGVTPTQGAYMAMLTTASQNGDANNFSGTDSVPAAALEAFLGLPAGALGTGFEGSAIKQSFTATAGDVLTFDYNFLTTEAGGQNDFAFVVLTSLTTLADANSSPLGSSGVDLDPAFGSTTLETGYRSFSITIPTTGSYTIAFGVVDAIDEFQPSALLVDNVQVGPASTVVPGPGGLVLAGVAAACLSAFGMRRRQG